MNVAVVAVSAAVLIGYIVTEYRRSGRSARKGKTRYEKEKESRRQAHYMQNFWNYDGSDQEEFEE